MTNLFAFDTNILIYSIDPTDVRKHGISDQIVKKSTRSRQPVPLQCITEFYRAVTRKRILEPQMAESFVLSAIQANVLVSPDGTDIARAIRWNISDKIQFFDALLLATAARSGCTTFFSEDFQHGRAYSSLTVRNPFQMSEDELSAVLA